MNIKYLAISVLVIIIAFIMFSFFSKPNIPTDQTLLNAKFETITSGEIGKYLKQPELVILDVRTSDEYKDGHVKNSLNLDFYSPNFKSELEKLDKNKQYLVYCRSGNRSSQASKLMQQLGFMHIINMTDSFDNIANSYTCTEAKC